ncbi:VR7ORF006c hypothetical protein [Escherichia phage vB_EcoM_VR7]|uniref:Endonuclease VII n=1 Tax=Escherichia phage vB_EcoM_VR7 TaxID=700939 RepID=E5FIC0_9CAUD|nr:endonuclease VII [Escherichia phage vB_EcoM_VR7]ADR32381.1 VR7ORF006c hypothetical protein [Escherichia phage vB_EcoM_VR7]
MNLKQFIEENLLTKNKNKLNGNLLKRDIKFWDDNQKFYDELIEISKTNQGGLRNQSPLNEACYRVLNDITSPVLCSSAVCTNKVNYHTFVRGYHKYCSKECAGCGEYVKTHLCERCGKPYEAVNGTSRYCSKTCQNYVRDFNALDRPFSKARGIMAPNRVIKSLLKTTETCEICGIKFDSVIRKNVDHCHKGGHVRGILCRQCNTGLGMFKDNIASLKNAIKYLNKHEETK